MKYPALAAWRLELQKGLRTTTTFDALWRAACREAMAAEYEQIVPMISEHYRAEAVKILERAV